MLPAPTNAMAIVAEGQRRLALLGPTLPLRQREPREVDQIRQRAQVVAVPVKRLLQWHAAQRVQGITGLQPQE